MRILLAFIMLITAVLFSAEAAASKGKGYVRLVREDDVWWFENSEGEKFFSLGVNCVGGCFGHYEESPLNEARKSWIVSQLSEMKFNTAGAWSSPSVWGDFYFADQIYTSFVEYLNDVFDVSFWTGFEQHLSKEVKPFAGNKNFIGYFLDNERAWDPCKVLQFYLHLSKDAPGSRALLEFLKDLYGEKIESLNKSWNSSFESFEDIPGSKAPNSDRSLLEKLFKPWRNKVAAQYYKQYCHILRKLDPNHLILGIRYKGIPDLSLFGALAPYFDANSINDYNRYGHLDSLYSKFYRISGKPLMITEFSFSGYPQQGQKSLLFIDIYSQRNRGIGYNKYVRSAARTSFMVGMHWFMWMDYEKHWEYPPDINVGLVSNDGTKSYNELARQIKKTNKNVNAAHQSPVTAENQEEPSELRLLSRFTPSIDGDLSEWSEGHKFLPQEVICLLETNAIKHTYYLSWDDNFLYLGGDISDSHLDYPGRDFVWQADYLSIYLGPIAEQQNDKIKHTLFYIYPTGGGIRGKEPYVNEWRESGGYQPVRSKVSKRSKAGGYAIEAAIPLKIGTNLSVTSGTECKLQLIYQDVSGIYRTILRNKIIFRP
ncbi:MAG: sugar-binding protein [Desulfoferrobacter sp.]